MVLAKFGKMNEESKNIVKGETVFLQTLVSGTLCRFGIRGFDFASLQLETLGTRVRKNE